MFYQTLKKFNQNATQSNAVHHPQFRFLVHRGVSGQTVALSLDWVVFPVPCILAALQRRRPRQCVLVCVPVVTGKNRELCALISHIFRIREQFNHRKSSCMSCIRVAQYSACHSVPLARCFPSLSFRNLGMPRLDKRIRLISLLPFRQSLCISYRNI